MMAPEPENADLERKTAGDHGLAVAKAALNLVPVVGGAMASLLDDYFPSAQSRRATDFIRGLAEDLKSHVNRVDQEFVKTKDFGFLFERTLATGLKTRNEEKLRALRAFLINAATRPHLPDAEAETMLRLLDLMTGPHLLVLRAFTEPEQVNSEVATPYRGGGTMTSIMQMLRHLFPDLSESDIEAIVHDLDQWGLLNNVGRGMMVMMTDPGIRQLGGRATPLGQEFISFVRLN